MMKTSVFYFIPLMVVIALQQACEPSPTNTKCTMIAEPGMCQAAIPRYYYNPQSGQCEQFIWGGCGDFPFETMQTCEEACE
jgi:Kunitz/Bovine pancreatic trypsin inhibitor domain